MLPGQHHDYKFKLKHAYTKLQPRKGPTLPPAFADLSLPLALQNQVMNELASNKVYLQGCDAQGRTVFIVLAKQQEKGRPEETKRFICYTLDNAIAAADPVRNELGQFLCLFDLSGMQHSFMLSC